jgi:FAD:protein FMN transferase
LTVEHRHSFLQQAMATTFKITIAQAEPVYAKQAAQAAFAELEGIEGRLSRYIESSDISRVNRLQAGASTWVHSDTYACLQVALAVQGDTGGAFDVAYGSAGSAAAGPRWELDSETHRVRVLQDGVRLDLGGIGKGFALDRLAALLADWDIDSALLCASTSTLLALDAPAGEPGWAVSLGPEHARRRFPLVRRSLSGSGTSVKGRHIIDPRTRQPADRRLAAWALAPHGAISDALSTAFLIMTEDEIRAYCRRHAEASAYLWRSENESLVCIP